MSSNKWGSDKLNVLLVAPNPPPYGGIAHWTQMIQRYADKSNGLNLHVINTAPTWRSIHNNGKIIRVFGGVLQLLRDCIKIVNVLLSRRCDAIHLTSSGQMAIFRDLVVSYLASLFCVKLVYHIHFGRIPFISSDHSLEWRFIRKVIRRAATVILIDRSSFDAIRIREPSVNAVVIPNCIDTLSLPHIASSNESEKVAMFLGSVIPSKGVTELVQAWRRLRPSGWRLDLVGSFQQGYVDSLLECQRSEGIRFLGHLLHEEAMRRLALCDLLVLPSYTEGFPYVVLEGMALGRPIIATDVGAIPEMLSDGAGILVKCRSSDQLVDGIARIINGHETSGEMGKIARDKAYKLYSIDIVFPRYVEIWRDMKG